MIHHEIIMLLCVYLHPQKPKPGPLDKKVGWRGDPHGHFSFYLFTIHATATITLIDFRLMNPNFILFNQFPPFWLHLFQSLNSPSFRNIIFELLLNSQLISFLINFVLNFLISYLQSVSCSSCFFLPISVDWFFLQRFFRVNF